MRLFDAADVLYYTTPSTGEHARGEPAELLGRAAGRLVLTVEMIHKIGAAWKTPGDPLAPR
ncbi:hypothetical protein [Bradyrhizobium sp.]|uniref:hypothetical protein n=1 Tax=Bradyrhizobium sp. TaxID=376 RepID=UPI0025C01D27|nr:hypothetical protein [Bradyrhizobium sp.]